MKIQKKDVDIIFDFKGLWDMPSKCGLKIYHKKDKTVVIVTELYKENTGTSITDVTVSLAKQICEKYAIEPEKLIYIERNPETNSKLSFYSEKNYQVSFDIEDGNISNPSYIEVSADDLKELLD
ncbi:MAG TPA: hypothetical protein PLO05_01415 [Bacteroidales bacterium]|jgi:hypothetical protein|nr:hypothetical protein [Bacteroidales bacterium]HRW21910.1 hypothetical protein [Bacteroidales bacterium]HXK80799.1 hypothetical protein [Bacteroidales bacterium]